MKRRIVILFFSILLLNTTIAYAKEEVDSNQSKIEFYKQMQALTFIPWYYFAAIHQYEKNIHTEDSDDSFGIQIPNQKWYGLLPNTTPRTPEVIQMFGGIGRDGNDDGIADPNDPTDVFYSFSQYIKQYGYSEQDIRTALWNYYKREMSVSSITKYAKLFETYDTVTFDDHAFPIPKGYNYSYKNTWGDARGFGGRRIHEGTDIFANYGTPVRSTTYGVIELKGWNRYGGWRIGIRDTHNRYHYYAHLNSFAEGIKIGDIVEAGQTIGSVGSTGYGPPGTSGKFPPHLHYGMYKDDGNRQWSFDPFPYLTRWEKNNP
ncbi:L-Ala-D-Glu endopeptidase [Gracilibacillus halophilus YIM-C55.5]|uniref:L-Ala-D-Glu endopeptidase n=1 Tax=Gracilibacillus halophilus YIM-C55.5 TaxID=1308866 RepID=N4WRV4_9BACI|nr:M23 family metallopeptidase [Gracilibacillus halophilus]ENH95926.1 L-Ala-D-Glu endopeptidase [Gracilibacillus halophilus YIM-C55.5]